jgi:hypothetical protein
MTHFYVYYMVIPFTSQQTGWSISVFPSLNYPTDWSDVTVNYISEIKPRFQDSFSCSLASSRGWIANYECVSPQPPLIASVRSIRTTKFIRLQEHGEPRGYAPLVNPSRDYTLVSGSKESPSSQKKAHYWVLSCTRLIQESTSICLLDSPLSLDLSTTIWMLCRSSISRLPGNL